jgi:hypothetical protein
MSTNSIIVLVLAAVVVIGGGLYYMNYGTGSTDYTSTATTTTTGTNTTGTTGTTGGTNEEGYAASLFEIANRSGDSVCTVVTPDTTMSGTVYISGPNLAADFSSRVAGIANPVLSHMIKNGTDVYVWSSIATQGVHMTQSVAEGKAGTQGQIVNGSQKYTWKCSGWAKEAGRFIIPTTIKFTNVTS